MRDCVSFVPSLLLVHISLRFFFHRSDLGAHVDGYVALVATTVVIGETEVTGRKADAIQAAKVASEAIIRLLQPGKKNSELTPLIEKVRSVSAVADEPDGLRSV